MNTVGNVEKIHQALGEFVIIFQWIESLYRQIGWFILDPERKDWPPMELRKETNYQLINKVTELYVDLTETYEFANGDEKARDIVELKEHFHSLRRFRNRLLHSTYIELKGGGEVHGYIRSNPEVGVDPESGELIFDQEDFSEQNIHGKIQEYGEYMFRLNLLHVQLTHWAPFERHGRKGSA